MEYSRPEKLLPIQMHNMQSARLENRLVIKGSTGQAPRSVRTARAIRSLDRMQDQLGVTYSNYNILQRLGHSVHIKKAPRKTLSVSSMTKSSKVEDLTICSGPHEIRFVPLTVTDLATQQNSKAPHSFMNILLRYSKDEIGEVVDNNVKEGDIFKIPNIKDQFFNANSFFISDKWFLKAKTEINNREKVGEFVKSIEKKGLEIKDLKIEDKNPDFCLWVKGEKENVDQLADIAKELGIYSLRIIDEASYLKPPYEINTEKLKIVLPHILYHSRPIPIPLGTLSTLIQNNFKEWDKDIKYLLKNPTLNASALKNNCNVKGEAVVLTLSAPKLAIPEIKSTVSFKLNDLSLFTQENCEKILVESISLEEVSGIRKKWNIKLSLPDLDFPGSTISFDFAGQATLNGVEMKYKIEPPTAEIYNPLTSDSQSVVVPQKDLLSLISTDFSDWESIVTSYFV